MQCGLGNLGRSGSRGCGQPHAGGLHSSGRQAEEGQLDEEGRDRTRGSVHLAH